jgi:hypothetical protein
MFYFWVEMVEPVFVTGHKIEQGVVILGSMSLKQV